MKIYKCGNCYDEYPDGTFSGIEFEIENQSTWININQSCPTGILFRCKSCSDWNAMERDKFEKYSNLKKILS